MILITFFGFKPLNRVLCSCMGLVISSLNSGSNGNAYYIGNEREAVLVDAGLSCRETERRLKRTGLSIDTIKAIFISHEHSDHIRGVEVLSRKYRLPVYITGTTLKASRLSLDAGLTRSFNAYSPVAIGELSVLAFPKLHDAEEPHSFTVSGNGVTIGVFTDIGSCCDHVVKNFGRCHAAFLEANYDDHLLETGSYPYHLKKRIRSDRGHLSNRQALDLFLEHGRHMSHLFLSHLSKDNNDPRLVEDLFRQHRGKTSIAIASRYNESPVARISHDEAPLFHPGAWDSPVSQMRLF
jgi:phosphoribosyl 1,2-cyclic phosphodiesterase